MEKNKIQKVNEPIVYLSGVTSLGVIGDPGCEGLGTYNMKVYAGALEKTSEDDGKNNRRLPFVIFRWHCS